MSETKPPEPGDIVSIAYFGDMPYHRRIGRVLRFRPAAFDVIVCDGHDEFEDTVAASKVVHASREQLADALRSRMNAPHAYVPKPKKPAAPKAEPVVEPIERAASEDAREILTDVTGHASLDPRYRELLQVLIDLHPVCNRAIFLPADGDVVDKASRILGRHLAAVLSPAPAGGAGDNTPHVAVRLSAGAGDSSPAVETGGAR